MSYKENDPDYYDIVLKISEGQKIINSTLCINNTLKAQEYFKEEIKKYSPNISEEELEDHLDEGYYNCKDDHSTPTIIMIIEPDKIMEE